MYLYSDTSKDKDTLPFPGRFVNEKSDISMALIHLLFTSHCTGRCFHAGSMKIPRQPAPYGAECSISVHREACYWTPYLCIAKRVTGHGVNSNLIQITPNTKSIKAGYRGNKTSPQYPAFFHTHLKDRFIDYAVLRS